MKKPFTCCLLLLCGYHLPLPAQTLAASIRPTHQWEVQGELISLKDALVRLEAKYKVSIMYDSKLVHNKTVKLKKQAVNSLAEELERVLSDSGLSYDRISDTFYVILSAAHSKAGGNNAGSKPGNPADGPLLNHTGGHPAGPGGLLPEHAAPAAVGITGRVTDAQGDGLPGVTVLLRGTTTGSTTNAEGNYSLDVPDRSGTLVFSSIGYVTREEPVGNRSVIDVTLAADTKALEEVVVVGYGEQKRSDLTGAVSSVSAKDIQRLAVPTLNQAIQGRAPGVYVTRNSGAPGSGAEIFIRGAGSIRGSEPLWIIDGVRTSPGPNFNMNDVEAIEILKDASAASIYGAAAANGVIIVTTKRGSKGAPKVSFNGYAGTSSPIGLPQMLNTEEYALLRNEAYDLAGKPRIPAFADPANLPPVSTDWVDVLYDRGAVQNYDLSVSGGGEKATFYVSGNYFREKGTLVDTWFERYTLRANSDFTIGKRLKIGESLMAGLTKNDPQSVDRDGYVRASPALPLYNPDNAYGGYGTVDRNQYAYEGGNPLASELRVYRLDKGHRINTNLYADLEIFKGLNLRTSFGGNFRFDNNRTFSDKYLGGGAAANNTASLVQKYNEDITLIGNAVLTFDKTLGRHNLKAMAGYEVLRGDLLAFEALGSGFAGTLNVLNGAASASRTSFGTKDSDRLLSQFGRLNYAYQGKYLLTANIRRDGSNKFGKENFYGIFPSFSAGWRISQEGFMQNFPLVSDLKLRGSWGILGNSQGIPRYLAYATYTTSNTTYSFGANQDVVQGVRPTRFPNTQVKWEEIEQTDIGLDLSLLNNQITVTADYYIKNTYDLLTPVSVPRSSGYLSNAAYQSVADPILNIGQMQNKGFELSVGYRSRAGKPFAYNVSANASYNKNTVKRLNADDVITSGNWDGDGFVARTEVGQPLGYYYGYQVEGIFGGDDEVNAANELTADANTYYQNKGTGPGDFKYRDIGSFDANGKIIGVPDGRINAADKTFIGNPWPKWVLGFNAGASFRNFDLSLFLQGVQGVDRYNSFKSILTNLKGDYSMSTAALNRWTPENPGSGYPRIHRDDPNRNRTTVSDFYVEDGSYLRVKNVQLGYTLPAALAGKIKLSTLRLYVSGDNLFTFTRYSGIDPEFDANSNSDNGRGGNTEKGIDMGVYPQARTLLFGLQIGL